MKAVRRLAARSHGPTMRMAARFIRPTACPRVLQWPTLVARTASTTKRPRGPHRTTAGVDIQISGPSGKLVSYDALSRLSGVLTVKRDGALVDIDSAQAGNQPEATRYHFDLLGRPDYTELPNGVVEDYVFDNMDRLDPDAALQVRQQQRRPHRQRAEWTSSITAIRAMETIGLTESFDTSGTGIRPGSSTLTNTYTWTYDNAGRLVSEVLDSSDNMLDQTEWFLMDLVGNRIRRTLDKPGSIATLTDIYTYDASDRLLNEQRYSRLFITGTPTARPLKPPPTPGTKTQQSSKTVSVSSVSSVVQIHELWASVAN